MFLLREVQGSDTVVGLFSLTLLPHRLPGTLDKPDPGAMGWQAFAAANLASLPSFRVLHKRQAESPERAIFYSSLGVKAWPELTDTSEGAASGLRLTWLHSPAVSHTSLTTRDKAHVALER